MLFWNPLMSWSKKHWRKITVGLGLVMGAASLIASRNSRVKDPRVALRVKKTAKEIAEKEVRAELLELQADDKTPELVSLQKEIDESKRRVAKDLEGGVTEGMTDAEIADFYRRSGL